MNHRFVKTSVVMIVSSVLLYYSVAWAVLRCFHDEDRARTHTGVSLAGLQQSDFLPAPLNHPKADIDCMRSSYHTETLAGSSAPSQMKTVIADVASRVNEFLTLNGSAETAFEDLRFTALLDRGATSPFPIDSPRYLSLSVLRI